MELKLKMNMDNAAFADGVFCNGEEVARLLIKLANSLDCADLYNGDGGSLQDRNGNTVGTWEVIA